MSLADLILVYALVGVACAIAVVRTTSTSRGGAVVNAVVALLLWPIWAPLTLTGKSTRAEDEAKRAAAPAPSADRSPAEASLEEAAAACAGTMVEGLLSRGVADRIAGEMQRAARRQEELAKALAEPSLDLGVVEARLETLVASGAPARAIATARLHRDNVKRLHAVRERDARALAELTDLAHALKTQLWLARVSGDHDGEAGRLVAELAARVEGLAAATPDPEEVA